MASFPSQLSEPLQLSVIKSEKKLELENNGDTKYSEESQSSNAESYSLLSAIRLKKPIDYLEQRLNQDPNELYKTDSQGVTILMEVVSLGDLEMVKWIIEKDKKKTLLFALTSEWANEKICQRNKNAAMFAAHYGHLEILKYLLSLDKKRQLLLGVDGTLGFSLLHFAAQGEQLSTIRYLVENYCDSLLDIKSKDSLTVMHIVAKNLFVEAYTYLAQKSKPLLLQKTIDGDTPLALVTKLRFNPNISRDDILRLSLREFQEAQINRIVSFSLEQEPSLCFMFNNKGEGAFHYLDLSRNMGCNLGLLFIQTLKSFFWSTRIRQILEKITFLENKQAELQQELRGKLFFLFQKMPDIKSSIFNPKVLQEFMKAMEQHDLTKLELLLKQHNDLLLYLTKKGNTALHVAIESNDLRMVEVLLANDTFGCLIYSLTEESEHPLHFALKHKKLDIALYLLKKYPDVWVETNRYGTLMFAVMNIKKRRTEFYKSLQSILLSNLNTIDRKSKEGNHLFNLSSDFRAEKSADFYDEIYNGLVTLLLHRGSEPFLKRQTALENNINRLLKAINYCTSKINSLGSSPMDLRSDDNTTMSSGSNMLMISDTNTPMILDKTDNKDTMDNNKGDSKDSTESTHVKHLQNGHDHQHVNQSPASINKKRKQQQAGIISADSDESHYKSNMELHHRNGAFDTLTQFSYGTTNPTSPFNNGTVNTLSLMSNGATNTPSEISKSTNSKIHDDSTFNGQDTGTVQKSKKQRVL